MNKTDLINWVTLNKARNSVGVTYPEIEFSEISMLMEVQAFTSIHGKCTRSMLNLSRYREVIMNKAISKGLIVNNRTGRKTNYQPTAKGQFILNQIEEKLPIIRKRLGLS